MSGPRCTGKVCYPSRREAAEAINAIMHPPRWKRRKLKKHQPKRLNSYRCEFCEGWHLTSRERMLDAPRHHRRPPATPGKFNWRKATSDE